MNLATWHSKRIRGLARVAQINQGETDALTLLKHDDNANNGTLINFTPSLIFEAGTFSKAPINSGFDGFNDGQLVFLEELQLSESALTDAQAKLVQAVDVGVQRYKASQVVNPRGLERYRRFKLEPLQTLSVITQTVLASQFTDGGGAAGTKTLATQIPAGALFQYAQVVVNVAFDGNTSAVLRIGDGADADRYNTGTPSVFTTGRKDMGFPSGTTAHASAATVTLTITGATDFTLINAAGSLTVWLYHTV